MAVGLNGKRVQKKEMEEKEQKRRNLNHTMISFYIIRHAARDLHFSYFLNFFS